MGGLIFFSTLFNVFLFLSIQAMSLDFLLKESFGLWENQLAKSFCLSLNLTGHVIRLASYSLISFRPNASASQLFASSGISIAFAKNIRHQREMIEKHNIIMQYKNDVIHS